MAARNYQIIYGGRSDMCEFCKNWHDKNTICGADIKIHKCANETELTTAQIMKNTNDNKPGAVIFQGGITKGYFEINYCPMCGRKLVEE